MFTIIGCGNSNRSDDGVGVYVAQSLMAYLRTEPNESVRIFDAGTGGIDVMFQAKGSSRLIIMDASSSGSPPGAIFEVPGDELIAEKDPGFSLHDFRWDHALYSGRKIFRDDFPQDVTVYLVEAAELGLGLQLSEPVQNAANELIRKLQVEIRSYE